MTLKILIHPLFGMKLPCVFSILKTSLPMFRSKQFAVKRRFSDFLGLYEKLSEKHSQNGFIVPPPPEKSLIGKSLCLLFSLDFFPCILSAIYFLLMSVESCG